MPFFRYFFPILLLLMSAIGGCVPSSNSVMVVRGDRVELTIPLQASAAEIDSISKIFSLQELHLEDYIHTGSEQYLRANGWNLLRKSIDIAVWTKPLSAMNNVYNQNLNTEENIVYNTLYPKASFGVNMLPDDHIRSENGATTFFLEGYTHAKQVILSGSFNGWSTMALPMTATERGWTQTVSLPPGKYLYKFIVDGRWIDDPNNLLREDDTHQGFNSVYFVENHEFILSAPSSKSVSVTGAFLNWSDQGIQMKQKNGQWRLPVYIQEGTHYYQFMVDGKAQKDPNNTQNIILSNGREASLLGIGTPVKFTLKGYSNAKEIILAASFNGWNEHDISLKKTATGWETVAYLGAGLYQYKYIIDGNWFIDPGNVVQMGIAPMNNSVLIIHPNYTFKLKGFTGAKNVSVTGDFLDWDRVGLPMQRTSTGWALPVYLEPGKHTYAFLVDGNLVRDPDNVLWEENGRPNSSVIWVAVKSNP